MPTVKSEPPAPARETQRAKKARVDTEPGMLDRVGASIGLCSRNLTKEEKAKRVAEFCKLSREPEDSALGRVLALETDGWPLPSTSAALVVRPRLTLCGLVWPQAQ